MKAERREMKDRAMRRVEIVQRALREWDPMGLAPGELAPADEYDSYAPPIVSWVAKGASVEEVAERLTQLLIEGFGTETSADDVAAAIVQSLRDDD